MTYKRTAESLEEMAKGVKQLKVALSLGKAVRQLEAQTQTIRDTIEQLGLTPVHPPEGHKFKVLKEGIHKNDEPLVIEPFNHRIAEWDQAYSRDSAEYAAIVGNDGAVLVDLLEYDTGTPAVWGYVVSRRVRVRIDPPSVNVSLVETE